MDIHEILGGDEWEIKITKSLEDASILLILLSTAWLKSDSCIKEYNTFRRFNDDKRRHIIPLQWRYIYPQELTTENDKQIMAQMESLQIIDWIFLINMLVVITLAYLLLLVFAFLIYRHLTSGAFTQLSEQHDKDLNLQLSTALLLNVGS